MKTDYLVCYDITRPRRLARVYRHLKGMGMHIQYSVFKCSLTWQQLGKLKEKLYEYIDEDYDDIRIYPLPAGGKVNVFGCGDRTPKELHLFI